MSNPTRPVSLLTLARKADTARAHADKWTERADELERQYREAEEQLRQRIADDMRKRGIEFRPPTIDDE